MCAFMIEFVWMNAESEKLSAKAREIDKQFFNIHDTYEH